MFGCWLGRWGSFAASFDGDVNAERAELFGHGSIAAFDVADARNLADAVSNHSGNEIREAGAEVGYFDGAGFQRHGAADDATVQVIMVRETTGLAAQASRRQVNAGAHVLQSASVAETVFVNRFVNYGDA